MDPPTSDGPLYSLALIDYLNTSFPPSAPTDSLHTSIDTTTAMGREKRKPSTAVNMAGSKKRCVQADNQSEQFPAEPPTPSSRIHQIFCFMDLPAELKNNVYEYDILNYAAAKLDHRAKSKLIPASPLARINRQIRGEYTKMAVKTAPTIIATVRNLNSSHIITFLNRLHAQELAKLATTEKGNAERTIKIRLKFEKNMFAFNRYGANELSRWLNRFTDSNKRGSAILFEYCCEAADMDRIFRSSGGFFHFLQGIAKYVDTRFHQDRQPKRSLNASAIRKVIEGAQEEFKKQNPEARSERE